MRSWLSHVTTPHPSFHLSCYVTPFRLGPLLPNWKQRTNKKKRPKSKPSRQTQSNQESKDQNGQSRVCRHTAWGPF
jgi:hypothetical protein